MTQSVIVWSREQCPYCDMAKNLLTQKGMAYEERKIGEGWTREQLLESVPAARSVPQIIINGEVIGGFNELKTHLS
jgi:glutaredoxin 3